MDNSKDTKLRAPVDPQIQMQQLRPVFACILALVLCIAIPIIALNLIMAWGDSPCLTQQLRNHSINMTLRTWLLVQAYVFIAVVSLVVIAILLACLSPIIGAIFGGLATCVLIPVSLFNMAWTIVGAIMFWGELYPARTCHAGLNIYMFIILIVGLMSICCTYLNQVIPKRQN